MPSLLSRFLGKKKHTEQPSLLDGEKFEAVPKTTSPSAPTFPGFTQRPKSKGKEKPDKGRESLPVLSLSLPEPKGEEKKSQGLGVVFEGITDGPPRLDNEALGDKRLTPSETLALVQKTSEVISERGLDTLGVMRPHWFASPRQQEIQLKLIHRFLQTLPSTQSNGNGPSSASQSTFDAELRYSRDPHDVAAVLRWGLRHLQLEGNSFGKTSSGTGDWYRTFSDSERTGSYPPKAFDDFLIPLLPPSHAQLLHTVLDLVSSLAAHSEENGVSGNKLSKVLGWWILSSRNTQGVGWQEFYVQWEAAARQFEHLFLAYIRATQTRMPKRLTELVKNYPFAKNRREEDGIYLPRPRLSTRSADALHVKVTAHKSGVSDRLHPLRIVEDAFKAKAENGCTGEYVAIWDEIRKVASKSPRSDGQSDDKEPTDEPESTFNLSTILADESIRLLSLVPTIDGPTGPTLSSFAPLPPGRGRRSLSVGDQSPSTPPANGRGHESPGSATTHPKAATSPNSRQEQEPTADWQLFSSSGFESPSGLSLAASLWDNDTEVTQPAPKKGLSMGKRNLSVTRSLRRGSSELPAPAHSAPESTSGDKQGRLTYGAPRLVKLDEAFIDFWADSLLDSVARTWPTFVVCQLKSAGAPSLTESGKRLEWLVIERVPAESARPPPPTIKTSAASARAASPVQLSPTASEGSKSFRWVVPTLSATRKRFSFFTPKHESAPAVQAGRDRAAQKAANDTKIGEMGEILRNGGEAKPNGMHANGPKTDSPTPKKNIPRKEVKKPEEAIPTPPTIEVNGISPSKPKVSLVPEKTGASKDSEPPAVSAEQTPVAALPTVEEVLDEPTQAPSPQVAVQPPSPDPTHAPPEPRSGMQLSQAESVSAPEHTPEQSALAAIEQHSQRAVPAGPQAALAAEQSSPTLQEAGQPEPEPVSAPEAIAPTAEEPPAPADVAQPSTENVDATLEPHDELSEIQSEPEPVAEIMAPAEHQTPTLVAETTSTPDEVVPQVVEDQPRVFASSPTTAAETEAKSVEVPEPRTASEPVPAESHVEAPPARDDVTTEPAVESISNSHTDEPTASPIIPHVDAQSEQPHVGETSAEYTPPQDEPVHANSINPPQTEAEAPSAPEPAVTEPTAVIQDGGPSPDKNIEETATEATS